MEFLAHVEPKTGRTQSIQEHLKNVCNLAEKNCPLDILNHLVCVAALLHDAGKLSEDFQEYMQEIQSSDENVKRRSIDHASAGGRLLEDMAGGHFVSRMVGTAIYSHHGLQDCIDLETGRDLTEKRREKEIDFATVKKRYAQVFGTSELKQYVLRAHHDIQVLCRHIDDVLSQSEEGKYGDREFFLGMYERLLLSVLIDSDWSDAAGFSEEQPLPERLSEKDTLAVWNRAISHFEAYMKKVKSSDPTGRLNQCRREISKSCYQASQSEKRLYRLTVPTGAGKTFSSLRFALYHAKKFKKRRILYVAPFNSILEQNAAEIRKAVGEESDVLEHHCNVCHDDTEKEEIYKKLTESWDSPIIVTTAVQMLNTLFSGQKSSIRRMYSLCNSIIIFDEVQAFPVRCTELFHLAVNFLVQFCNTTVVLCSATQPSIAQLAENNLLECEEMVGNADHYTEKFRRTRIIDQTARVPGGMRAEDLRDFILDAAGRSDSILAIVNTRAAAREVYQALKSSGSDEYELYHLSTSMCPENRRRELEAIKAALKEKKKIICVSTQLVEAGVDFSFGCVIRSLAGMDSIIQAAGRCNRHREKETEGEVYIVKMAPEAERIDRFYEMKAARRSCERLLYEFRQEPEAFDRALDSEKAIRRYYRLYYHELGDELTKYPVSSAGTCLTELLGRNRPGRNQYARQHGGKYPEFPLNQAFQTAGNAFEVIPEDEKIPVIVPYDENAEAWITELERPDLTVFGQKKILRKLQRYTVGISKYMRDQLNNAVYSAGSTGVLILSKDYYNEKTGVMEAPVSRFLDF